MITCLEVDGMIIYGLVCMITGMFIQWAISINKQNKEVKRE